MKKRNKQTMSLLALCLMSTSSAHAVVSMLPVTGWNYDMVHNGSGPYAAAVSGTMDGGFGIGGAGHFEDYTWVEAGTYLNPDLNPQTIPGLVAGTHSSLTGNGTFTFQDFSANNAIGLNGGETATLFLDTPASYSQIALFGASAQGSKTVTVTLNFTDFSSTEHFVASGTGIGTDWFNTNGDRAMEVGSRASNRGEDGNVSLFLTEDTRIAINESLFTLSAADQLKTLDSVTITNTGGDRLSVLAISGQTVPEPSSVALLGLGGLALMLRRRRG